MSEQLEFDNLPLNIWGYIFNNVKLRELVRCERVCKLWQYVIPLIYSVCKELDTDNLGISGFNGGIKKHLDAEEDGCQCVFIIDSVLQRIRLDVETINLYLLHCVHNDTQLNQFVKTVASLRCPKLRSLKLSGSYNVYLELDIATLRPFFGQLQSLSLCELNITNRPDWLTLLNGLQTLEIRAKTNVETNRTVIFPLKSLRLRKLLISVDVADALLVDDEEFLTQSAIHCPNVTSVTFEGNVTTGLICANFLCSLPQLNELDLTNFSLLFDAHLSAICETCVLLTRLTLIDVNVDDFGCLTRLARLTYLRLVRSSIDNDTFLSIASHCRSISALNFKFCENLFDLHPIAYMSNLKDLRLNQLSVYPTMFPNRFPSQLSNVCLPYLNSVHLNSLASCCPHLKQLSVLFGRDVNEIVLADFVTKCTKLTDLNVCMSDELDLDAFYFKSTMEAFGRHACLEKVRFGCYPGEWLSNAVELLIETRGAAIAASLFNFKVLNFHSPLTDQQLQNLLQRAEQAMIELNTQLNAS